MKAKSFLTLLFLLGLMFGHEAFASVEPQPQSEVVTSTGERFQYCSADQCLSEGERVIFLPSRCEYVRTSWLYQDKTCYSAEVVYVTEAELVHELAVAKPSSIQMRLHVVAAMLAIVLMLSAVLLKLLFKLNVAVIATVATAITLLVFISVPLAASVNLFLNLFLDLFACFAFLALIVVAGENQRKPKLFYIIASVHIVAMTVVLFLMW